MEHQEDIAARFKRLYGVDVIDPSDIPADSRSHPKLTAVRAMEPGMAIKMECDWTHSGTSCPGQVAAWALAKKTGFKVKTRHDRVSHLIYVWRVD